MLSPISMKANVLKSVLLLLSMVIFLILALAFWVAKEKIVYHYRSGDLVHKVISVGPKKLTKAIQDRLPAKPEVPEKPRVAKKIVAGQKQSGVLTLDDFSERWMYLVGGKPEIKNFAKLFNQKTDEKIVLSYTRVSEPLEFWMVFPAEMDFSLEKLRYYDGDGSLKKPTKFYFIKRDKSKPGGIDWKRIPGPVYDGQKWREWENFDLKSPLSLYAMVVEYGDMMPDELELIGNWTSYVPEAYENKKATIGAHLGTNSYVWNIMQASNRGLYDEKAGLFKAFSGGRTRDYFDWAKLEPLKGEYTFAPSESGAWNYDTYYKWLHDQNIDILTCLKNNTTWSLKEFGYPNKNNENAVGHWTKLPEPVKPKDASATNLAKYEKEVQAYQADISKVRTNPESYRAFAEAAFQVVARYGSNKKLDPKLAKPFSNPTKDPKKEWYAQDRIPVVENPKPHQRADWKVDANGQYVQNKKIGLGYIRAIECDNETDATWHGDKRYLRPEQYAWLLSVFYDGHKNTMGPGIGVKNADPNIIVSTTGIASSSPSYFQAMIETWKQIRGWKKNEKGEQVVDMPCDIFNYHAYANSGGGQHSGGNQGLPPEVSNMARYCPAFLQTIKEVGQDKPVWITEIGYGMNEGKQQAVATPARTKEQTQADWIIRSILFNNRNGIAETYFYQTYDETGYTYNVAHNKTDNGVYSAMGLIQDDKKFLGNNKYASTLRRRFSADYMMQLSYFKDYRYSKTLHKDPLVDQYQSGSKTMYALVVPDMKGRTEKYTLDMGKPTAKVYRFVDGGEKFAVETVKTSNGKLNLTVTESPVFVE